MEDRALWAKDGDTGADADLKSQDADCASSEADRVPYNAGMETLVLSKAPVPDQSGGAGAGFRAVSTTIPGVPTLSD